MRSAVSPQPGKCRRSRSVTAKNSAVSYFLRIRARTPSEPDCSERWKWPHTRPSAARRAQNSSVTTVGSREPRRSRSSGAAREMVSTASARPGVPGRSAP